MEKAFDILVIGGGPGGISLSRIINGRKEVGVIRPEDHSMIYCAMPYVIEQIIPREKSLKKDALVTESGAELIRDRAVKTDFDSNTVYTANGDIYHYNKLIIATGAIPVLPPVEGIGKKGVSTFKTSDDMDIILGAVDAGVEIAVVIGAGAIGVELAQAFASRDLEIHLVDTAGTILPNLVDSDMVKDVTSELEQKGIHLHLGRKVLAVEGNGVAEAVRLDDNTVLQLTGLDFRAEGNKPAGGLVLFAIGMRPDVDLFRDTKLDIGRDGIIVNDRMETNIRDVYAIGDCVQFVSGITGEVIGGKLATNAIPMAKLLARNLMGDDRSYPGYFNGAATKVGDLYIGGTGFSQTAAERAGIPVIAAYAGLTTKFPMMPDSKPVKVKLVVNLENHRLVGGQVVSGEPVTDKIDLLTFAIQKHATVEDLAALSYSSQPYQAFFPANNHVVQAAENIISQFKGG